MDNYGTNTPLRFGRHSCFHAHFTPTSASWLNQVERWFATLTEKQIRRGTRRSIRELERHPRLPAQLQRSAFRLDQIGRRPFSTARNASACEEQTQDTSGRTPQAFSLCSLWPSSRSCAAGAIVRGTAVLSCCVRCSHWHARVGRSSVPPSTEGPWAGEPRTREVDKMEPRRTETRALPFTGG